MHLKRTYQSEKKSQQTEQTEGRFLLFNKTRQHQPQRSIVKRTNTSIQPDRSVITFLSIPDHRFFLLGKRVQSTQLNSLQLYNVETERFIQTTSLETQAVRESNQNTQNSRLSDKGEQLSGGRKRAREQSCHMMKKNPTQFAVSNTW